MVVVASPEYQDLEHQLREMGNRLACQSLSDDELLPLFDRVEHHLSRVEQAPPKSMLDALSLSMNTLVEDRYLRHSDVDVKVSIASCISEIMRITAPDAPYEDDKMKDVFQLIVSSFKDLSDQSSRSYTKRASILETVAKVRSCVVMLDLECDGLIVKMFQHFLKAIRDYHPENVFSSMETIMALVLEESEVISLELLTPILASVKKDDEEVLPVARKLGEKVFEKAADKLKFYLVQAVKSLGVPLEDYSQVVAVICNKTAGAIEQNDDNASGQPAEESKLTSASSEKGDAGDSEAKPLRQSGKKGLTIPEAKPISQTTKKGDASGSGAKPQKPSGKRGITSHSLKDKSSLKKKEDGKKRGRGQDATVKDLAKSSVKEDELVSPPKSTTKSAKEEDHFDEPNTTTSKWKRTPNKDKASETAGNGFDLVGVKVKVWWPKDCVYYDAVIKSYDPVKKRHTVHYPDDEVEVLNLRKERWVICEGASTEDGAVEDSSPNGTSKAHKKKKKMAKTDSEQLQAQDTMDISPKRVGAASSSKLKASASKSDRKTKVEGKVERICTQLDFLSTTLNQMTYLVEKLSASAAASANAATKSAETFRVLHDECWTKFEAMRYDMSDLKVSMDAQRGELEQETHRLFEEMHTKVTEIFAAKSYDNTDMLKHFRMRNNRAKEVEAAKLAAIEEEKNMKALNEALLAENNRLRAELELRRRTFGQSAKK